MVTHLELLDRPVGTLVDILLGAGEVNGLDTAGLLSGNGGGAGSSNGRGTDEAGGGNEGASLNGGRHQFASHWAAESLGKASGG